MSLDSLSAEGVPSVYIDRAGTISDWNPSFESMWGRPAADAVGRKLAQILVALDPAELPDFDSVRLAGAWSGVVALVPSNGKAPRPTGIHLSTKVHTDTLQMRLAPLSMLAADGPTEDAALEPGRDLQRFAAMLEFVPGFCYTVNRDLVFTSSAGKGLLALNLRPGQVIGMNLRDLWGTHDETYEPLICHLKALAGIPATYKDVCLDRSLEYVIRPLRDDAGEVVGAIGVGVDVTDGEHARAEQMKLTAQLRQAQKMEAMGRLAGGIAHDFNNYLTCIMGNLAMLESQIIAGKESVACLADATAAVDSAASLTRQLLAFSRKQVISPRPISLSSLVERVCKILDRLVGDRITLRTLGEPALWNVNADPGQIEQVLVNLVVNARDAIAGDGQILIETRNLELSAADALLPESLQPGQYVALAVTDTGRGLSDLERSRLFEPFFTTKDVGEGTGLGLATVYGAVQQNCGAITVESDLGKGTTFRILLPRVDAAEALETPSPTRTAQEAIPGGTETILLVEDEPSVLDLAHRILQQVGYNVLPCSGPDEALRTFAQYHGRIALLVTDLMMPRMNGKELAARITALSPGIPVLFTSGYGENIIAKQGIIDDGIHFIGKPYRPRELALRVRALLDMRLTLTA